MSGKTCTGESCASWRSRRAGWGRLGPAEAEPAQGGVRVSGGFGRGWRGSEAEQAAAMLLAKQQREERLGEERVSVAVLGPDVLGEPGDVPGVALGMEDRRELGESARLGDDQLVQADQFVGVQPEHDTRGEGGERTMVNGGVRAHRRGQVRHHRGEQPGLVPEVGIHRALGHLGRRRELLDRGFPEARAEEDRQGGGEDLGLAGTAFGGGGTAALADGGNSQVLRHADPLPYHNQPAQRGTIGHSLNDTI